MAKYSGIVLKKIFTLLIIIYSHIFAQNYYHKESFEYSNPFVFWTSSAGYKLNYFGLSSEKASDGSSCFKMDITINGSGDKECYYYWKLPVKTNLHGLLDFSADLYMDSLTAQYVKLGYHYGFPPTTIERTPTASSVTGYNKWFKQAKRLSEDVMYHADYFAQTKIYSSTSGDFGRELQFLQLSIRAKGSMRLVFYIDNIQLNGEILPPQEFINYYTERWTAYKSRLSVIKVETHNRFNSLPSIPDTTGKKVTLPGIGYYNQLKSLRADMLNLFTTIDNSEYFDTAVMDSMNYKLNLFPSVVLLLNNEMSNSITALNVYTFPSTIYNRLDENNFPSGLKVLDDIAVRMCRGEYEPFSLLLHAKTKINSIKVNWTDFNGAGGSFDSSAMDVSIAKVWYQAGLTETEINNKILTQELLIKNDTLIKVDRTSGKNYLLVKKSDGTLMYTDISTPGAVFPDNVSVEDSKIILPFNINAAANKQLWFTIKVPVNANPGSYESMVSISDPSTLYKTFKVRIEVLPFNLNPSRLIYGIYYNGYLDNYLNRPFHFTNKTSAQLRLELSDMKEHGILYPTTYQTYSNLDGDLQIRNEVGLPNDKLFAAGFKIGTPQTTNDLNTLKTQVLNWKNKIAQYGYKTLYAYGVDEASGAQLTAQRQAWEAVHQAGGKVFVAGYYDLITEMKDLIDAGVVFGDHDTTQPSLYHNYGNYIFSYSNPQAGHENPEIYRRNFGIALWKAGYDGAMDYAYQKNYGSTWNDFDGTKYRDQNFTYPATNSIISTVQWEGFREGIDDVRYLSTLLNEIDNLKTSGVDVSEAEQWVNSIDPSGDLDQLRQTIIDKIIYLNNLSIPVISRPSITEVSFVDSSTLKIKFSKCVDPLTIRAENFTIMPSLQINDIETATDLRTVYLKTTSAHQPFITYSVSVRNVTDMFGNNASGNPYSYSFKVLTARIKVYLQGALSNGLMHSGINSYLPKNNPFNKLPWNYQGEEKLEIVPGDVIDWMLVELRSDFHSEGYRKAVLLRNDAQLVDTDGTTELKFHNSAPGSYYIVLKHRNHLSIISSAKYYISDSPVWIDLTQTTNVHNSCEVAQLNTSGCAMLSGDCDGNGKIEVLDFRWSKQNINQTGYNAGDLNFNGVVDDADYLMVKDALLKYSSVK